MCHNNHSTCDDNDNVTINSDDSVYEENENIIVEKNLFEQKLFDEANDHKDLNELVDYINEDDCEKIKNSSSKKKKTNQNKKKKKSKKNLNSDFLKEEKILEEDKIIIEFKVKLENDSLNAKEVILYYYIESKN